MRKLVAILCLSLMVWYFLNSAEDGAPSILQRWRSGGNWVGREALPPGRSVAAFEGPSGDSDPTAPRASPKEPGGAASLGALEPLRNGELRAVDWTGRPLGALELELVEPQARAGSAALEWLRSAADGRLSMPTRRGVLRSVDPAWISLSAGLEVGGDLAPPLSGLVVFAPAAFLRARVVDEQGRGVAGASVRLFLPLSNVAAALGAELPERFETRGASGVDGLVEFPVVPDVPNLSVEARAAGFSTYQARAERSAEGMVEVHLQREP
jgi:hypothetical protein